MTTVRQLPDTRRFSGCTAIVTAADGGTRILANVAGGHGRLPASGGSRRRHRGCGLRGQLRRDPQRQRPAAMWRA